MRAIRELDILQRNVAERQKWLRTIGSFAASLTPFNEAIGIFVSSHPEYAALVWGTLRLIMQVGSATSFAPFHLFGVERASPWHEVELTSLPNSWLRILAHSSTS